MSIFTALYTGSSGIQAHTDAIGVIGDDLANTSTVGFESQSAQFSDVIGGTAQNGQELGQGVRMSGVDTEFSQGSLTATGEPLNMAIQGNGLFEVAGNYNGVQGNFYSRDGQFSLDNTGTVVNNEGLAVQGYTIDATGKMSQSVGNLVLGGQSAPNATTQMSMSANLDSSATPMVWNPANPSGTSNYSTSATVYDSLGTAHNVTTYFTNTGTGAWDWHSMVDGGELAGGTAGTQTQIANGSMTFNTNGALQTETTASSSASFVGASANQAITFNFGDPIATGGTGLKGTTQFAGSNAINALSQDGYGSGTLAQVSVAADGTVTGQFSNGQSRPIARVALASFANEGGLERAGDQLFTQSQSSGAPLVGAAATGGSGSIVGGSVESSNVNLSSDLVTMIAYQRAFSANSRTVTTADQMLQEIVAPGGL